MGISIGLFPAGPTSSAVDVPGVGVGHVTIWSDDPAPPEGEGVARTGVTAIDFGGNMWQSPIPAGGSVLNGNGECTGLTMIRECGVLETPIFLTSTMQVGRVYDGAVTALVAEEPMIGVADVIIPVVAECDDSFLSDPRRVRVTETDVATALARARENAGAGQPPEQGSVGAGSGMCALGYKGGIGTASRVLPDGHIVAVVAMTNYGEHARLTVDGLPVGKLLPDPAAAEAHPKPAGSCIVVVITDGPLDAAGCSRLAARAGLGLARTGSTAHHGSGEIFLAVATGLRTR
ncbi:MAG TPA: P1 family peptidase, partial [Micromonosporaceae bacterium]